MRVVALLFACAAAWPWASGAATTERQQQQHQQLQNPISRHTTGHARHTSKGTRGASAARIRITAVENTNCG